MRHVLVSVAVLAMGLCACEKDKKTVVEENSPAQTMSAESDAGGGVEQSLLDEDAKRADREKSKDNPFLDQIMKRFDDDGDDKLSRNELDDLIFVVKLVFQRPGPHHGRFARHGRGYGPAFPMPGDTYPEPMPLPNEDDCKNGCSSESDEYADGDEPAYPAPQPVGFSVLLSCLDANKDGKLSESEWQAMYEEKGAACLAASDSSSDEDVPAK